MFAFALLVNLGMGASVHYGYAQCAIGMVYGNEFDNWGQSKKWLLRGSERGNQFAQTMLGSYYALLGDSFEDPNYFLNADGANDTVKIEQSFAEGFKWLRLAADQDNVLAQELLVTIYCDADGLGNEELEEAKHWCQSDAKYQLID
jgi:TPR repeat protein